MINLGVKPTIARPALGTDRPAKLEKQEVGAKFSDVLEKRSGSGDRTERVEKPGREDRMKTAREGKRSADGDSQASDQKDERVDKKNAKAGGSKPPAKLADKSRSSRTTDAPDDKESDDEITPSGREGQSEVRQPLVAAKSVTKTKLVESNDETSSSVLGEVQKAQTPSKTSPDQGIKIDLNEAGLQTDAPEVVQAKSMQEFAEQMQSQFGIAPEKIVEAFSMMTAQQLEQPPEESAKALIANLGLTGSQATKATEMYQNMLEQTAAAFSAPTEMHVSVMTTQEEALGKLSAAIDDLNKSFAVKGPGQPVSQMPAQAMPAEVVKAAPTGEVLQSQLLARMMAQPKVEQPKVTPKITTDDFTESSGVEATELLAGDDSESSVLADGSDLLGAGAIAQALDGNGANLAQGQSQGGQSSNQSFQDKMKPKAASEKIGETKSVDKSAGFKVDAKEKAEVDLSGLAPGAMGAVATTSKEDVVAKPVMMPVAPTTQDEQDNVKELLRQAQIVLKNGGGELNMSLKPQGMGEVKLKVTVNEGQVSVEMLTESDQAKRLLEKGLHELKSSLSAENLRVDTLKVDVGAELKKHMDPDGNQDSSREQARQMAREHMDQFRQEREGFRQGFMDNSGWKSYNQNNRRRADVEPEPTVANIASARSQAKGSSRLNLVG